MRYDSFILSQPLDTGMPSHDPMISHQHCHFPLRDFQEEPSRSWSALPRRQNNYFQQQASSLSDLCSGAEKGGEGESKSKQRKRTYVPILTTSLFFSTCAVLCTFAATLPQSLTYPTYPSLIAPILFTPLLNGYNG